MIDRDRNTLYEGDVVEDAAGQLWLEPKTPRSK
jgi:hypothetical protein